MPKVKGSSIYTKEEESLLKEVAKIAESYSDLTRAMGMSRDRCKYMLKKFKIKTPKMKWGGDRCSKEYIKKHYGGYHV